MQLLHPGLITFFYKFLRNFLTIGQFFQTFVCFAFMSRTAKKTPQFGYLWILTKICQNRIFSKKNSKGWVFGDRGISKKFVK